MSTAIAVLVATALVPIVLVVVAARTAHRRLPAPWSLFWWGALAFVASQVLRVPLLAVIGIAAPSAAVMTGVAVATSGLFEETARLLVLRFGARAREWRDGVMVGLGHGGIEAILVLGLAAVGGIALLTGGDALLEAARQAGAEQADAVAEQIRAVRAVSLATQAVAVWERVCSVVVHVALTLIVLRGARAHRAGDVVRWWLVAVVIHAAFNWASLVALRVGGILATEVLVTVCAALALWFVIRSRADALETDR